MNRVLNRVTAHGINPADHISLGASFVLTGLLLITGCALLGWLVVVRPEFRVDK